MCFLHIFTIFVFYEIILFSEIKTDGEAAMKIYGIAKSVVI